jgi:enoyl-CoA hydratase/carnithine racemase
MNCPPIPWHIVTNLWWNRVFSPGHQPADEAFRLAKRMALSSPVALAIMKRAAEFAGEMSLEACFSHELSDFNTYWQTNDRPEGFNAFFEKREPKFTGK